MRGLSLNQSENIPLVQTLQDLKLHLSDLMPRTAFIVLLVYPTKLKRSTLAPDSQIVSKVTNARAT